MISNLKLDQLPLTFLNRLAKYLNSNDVVNLMIVLTHSNKIKDVVSTDFYNYLFNQKYQ
jgi:hypothetical protein